MSTTIETLKNSNGAMLALAAIAFMITAVLVFFIIRMLIGGRLRMPGGRARQARLGIVDAFDLDRQRQLILVRRDNTEHLIMIGGPNDLLIESEIVRAEARDLRRDKAPEFMAGSSDGRIPAPFAQSADREAAEIAVDPAQGVMAPPLEPLAPLPLPVSPQRQDDLSLGAGMPAEPVAQRMPTFPLPPRRPPPPERRLPPRPSEPLRPAVRLDPPLMEDGLPRRPTIDVPADPPIETSAAIEVAPLVSPPPAPLVAPAPAPPRAAPPSFLKPLPPRPPIRPLVRSNPRPPGETAAPIAPPQFPVSPPVAPTPLVTEAPDTEIKAAAGLQEASPHDATLKTQGAREIGVPKDTDGPKDDEPRDMVSKDALESLEEEMAKLLGRGPGS